MAHPSSALLTGLFLFSTIVIIKLKFKYIINFFIASLLTTTNLFKLQNLKILTSKQIYYKRMVSKTIHDEPDDFLYFINLVRISMKHDNL